MSIQKKGDTYYVVLMYRDANNKKKYKWIRAGTSLKEAQKLERQLKTDIDRGEYVLTDKQTTGAFLDQWLELQVKPNNRIGTFKKCEAHVKAAKESFGMVQLDKLTGLQIQKFLSAGKAAGKSGTYLYDQYATLKRAFDCAVKWGLLNKNPVAALDAPKKDKPQTVAYTPQQVEILLSIVRDTDIYLPVVLGVMCGLRRGEICGLRWQDVDMKKSCAMIRNSLDVHDGEYILGPVKTDTSEGVIPLPKIVMAALRRERIKQFRDKLSFRESYTDTGYCWRREDGLPHHPDYLYHKLKKLIDRYNKDAETKLPQIRVHDLRHTHATLLLRAGVDTKIVSRKLRHADFRFTAQRYQHVQSDMLDETAVAMDEMFKQRRLENGLEKTKSPPGDKPGRP